MEQNKCKCRGSNRNRQGWKVQMESNKNTSAKVGCLGAIRSSFPVNGMGSGGARVRRRGGGVVFSPLPLGDWRHCYIS